MKTGTTLSLALAAAGLLALAAPANAQNHRGGGSAGSMNHGGGHFVGDHGRFFSHGRFFNGSRVNFFVGGFGPWWGWGYPYYAYGYYPYPPPYGYYGPASGDQQGAVYNGRIANPRENGDSKDTSSVPERVQRQLAQTGYYHGPIDGVIGDGTQRAIRNYQRDNGLPVTGRIDDSLLNSMGRS